MIKHRKPGAARLARGEPTGNKHSMNRVTELWGLHPGADIFVCGTGPSLTGFDWSRLNNKITIALNDALLADGFAAKYHIFIDVGIYKRYRDFDTPDPEAKIVCQPKARTSFLRYEGCSFKDRVYHFNHVRHAMSLGERRRRPVCNKTNDDLYASMTVATAGIMMAFKLGARRVFLLGVDGYKYPGKDGGVYYYNGTGKGIEKRHEFHPIVKLKKKTDRVYSIVSQDRHEHWNKNMRELREWFDFHGVYQERFRTPKGVGSNVFNLSGMSTIDVWEKVKFKTIFGPGCFKR